MKRTNILLSTLVVASSIAMFQGPAQASRGSNVVDAVQQGGRIIRKVIPDRIRIKPHTAKRQFQSCVEGYRKGPSKIPLPTARNMCAHLKR